MQLSLSQSWQGESEERLRAFIDSAPQKMWVSRTDGSVEFFNREWRNYTGQRADAETQTWRDAVHPQDRAKLEEIRTGAIAQTRPYDTQFRLRRSSDGAYRWHVGRAAPVHLDGQLIAWIGVATDI